MTILEVEMRVRERQQQLVKISENNRLLSLAPPPRSLRIQLAQALFALSQRLDPQLSPTNLAVPCQEC